MTTTFRETIERLRRDAIAATQRRVFDAGRVRQTVLAAHADVASVLAALADDREATYPARETLTRALLAEHRKSNAGLWATTLVVAYYPMLSRLRHRLFSNTVPRDELDQVVITAFLATLNELPLRDDLDRLAMRLRQRTERQVFAFLRKEREQQSSVELDEVAMFDTDAMHGRRLPSPDDERFDLGLVLDHAAALGIHPSGLKVVATTVLRGELLRSYVERVGPDDRLERERMYQRLKRQRSRALKRLRAIVAESPTLLAAGF